MFDLHHVLEIISMLAVEREIESRGVGSVSVTLRVHVLEVLKAMMMCAYEHSSVDSEPHALVCTHSDTHTHTHAHAHTHLDCAIIGGRRDHVGVEGVELNIVHRALVPHHTGCVSINLACVCRGVCACVCVCACAGVWGVCVCVGGGG